MLKTPLYPNEEAFSEAEYERNIGCNNCEPLGYGTSQASHSAISMSMVGWGLGLAVAIAIVAGVIHQSAAAHNDSSSSSSSSSSS